MKENYQEYLLKNESETEKEIEIFMFQMGNFKCCAATAMRNLINSGDNVQISQK